MRGIIFVGGAASVGKTTICKNLELIDKTTVNLKFFKCVDAEGLFLSKKEQLERWAELQVLLVKNCISPIIMAGHRLIFDTHYSFQKRGGPEVAELDEIFNGGETSWKTEALREMEQLVKEKNVAGLEPKLVEYAKKGAMGTDLEFKILAFMTLGRYAEYVSSQRAQNAAKVHDEIGRIVMDGASKGNYRAVSEALKTADKVAANSKAAVSFIKMWCGNTVVTPVRTLAREIAKKHSIPFG